MADAWPWRLRPLLLIGRAVARRLVRGSVAWLTFRPGSRPRRVARRVGIAAARYVLALPFLALTARQLLRRFPAVRGRWRMMLLRVAEPHQFQLAGLSAHARGVYSELKAAVARRAGRR